MKKIMIETMEPGDPRIAQLVPEQIAAFAAQTYFLRTKTEARKWLSDQPLGRYLAKIGVKCE